MKKRRSQTIDLGNDCPKCGQKMERRKHNKNEKKYLNRAYYYTEWDYCKSCNYVQHYNQFKMWPPKGKNKTNARDVWAL